MTIINKDDIINTFKTLPKYCGCTSCTEVKEKSKAILGKKEFKKLAKKLDITY